jgi:cytochrome c oxidase subunit IV
VAIRATFVLVWLSAMVLLGINIGISKLDLGPFAPLPIMLIAATQALLIVWFFLHVRRASALVRLAAFAAFFWAAVLFSLSLSDYLTRGPTGWPPELPSGAWPHADPSLPVGRSGQTDQDHAGHQAGEQ